MPDYSKSLTHQTATGATVAAAAAAATTTVAAHSSPSESSLLSEVLSPHDGDSVGVAEGAGGGRLAQGFFGVYDGHCGSEAVQFVRDRLHGMVGEHASFWEVRLWRVAFGRQGGGLS